MKKSIWQWQKHDVVNYLRANLLEKDVEFTTETLIKKIKKLGAGSYFYGYEERVVSEHLFELCKEGYLSVRYISVDMKPEEHHFQKLSSGTRFLYKEKWRTRWGSKTVAVYQMVDRKEKIEKILKN
jgi:hypothetical protein